MDSSDKKKLVIGGLVLVVFIAVGFHFASKWQAEFNVKADEAAKNSDGGQIGHIGALYDTLERTDPVHYQPAAMPSAPQIDEDALRESIEAARAAQSPTPVPRRQLPVVQPAWDMDIDSAELPVSQVNGLISGTNFLAGMVRFGRNGTTYILSFRQGTNAIADAEVLVVLRLKAGEGIETNTWQIAKDTRIAPQIFKKWKTGPRMVAQKSYSSGYAMKLEFGEIANGVLPGRIYLALPDKEQSVIAGEFEAETQLTGRREVSSGY